MAKELRRYVLDVALDDSFFERNRSGRNVFRYRMRHVYLPFRSTPERAALNPRRHFRKHVSETDRSYLGDVRLFGDLSIPYERLIR